MSLRVVSYNIRYGGVGREAALAETIQKLEPDVVLLQEATRPESVERIARDAGMPFWGSRRGPSVGYLSRLPVAHNARQALRGSRGRCWPRARCSRSSRPALVYFSRTRAYGS